MSISHASQRGFTMIELLVVMAIILILTQVAVPKYAEYRKRGFDLRAASDLRNVAMAEEAYFLDNEGYLSCENNACQALPGISALSAGTQLSMTSSELSFTGNASHPKGTGRVFTWDSERGGMLE